VKDVSTPPGERSVQAMTFPRRYSSALLTVVGSLLLGGTLLAQSTSQPAQAVAQPATMKLSVLVLDKKKEPVTDLRREDFQVFEGDEPQAVTFFSKEDVPVSYGLLIDSSGSLREQFPKIIEAGKLIVSGGGPSDETFLVRFISSDKIELALDYTADKAALQDRIGSFKVEGGRTALVDALYQSATYLAKRKPGEDLTRRRRALILVSDGEERGSLKRPEELIQFLRKADIQVFAIGLVTDLDEEGSLIRKSPRVKAAAFLEELAKETGGRAFIVESPSKLRDAALGLARHLHSQYVIGYNATCKPGKDAYCKVRVKLTDAPGRDKFKVIARAGYNAL
jgi:Ca-activated chloride channel family protein